MSLQTRGRATEAKGLHSGQVNMGSGTQGSAPDNVSGTRLEFTCERAAGWKGREGSNSTTGRWNYSGQTWTLREGANPAAFSHNLCFLVVQTVLADGLHALL